MSLSPKVRALRKAAMDKLNRGERVKGALGAAQRAEDRQQERARKHVEAMVLCKCGCGEYCRGTFKRGHAARYYQRIRAYLAGELTLEQLPKHMRAVCCNPTRAAEELGGRYAYRESDHV